MKGVWDEEGEGGGGGSGWVSLVIDAVDGLVRGFFLFWGSGSRAVIG